LELAGIEASGRSIEDMCMCDLVLDIDIYHSVSQLALKTKFEEWRTCIMIDVEGLSQKRAVENILQSKNEVVEGEGYALFGNE
jgi:hypothetical protein